MDSVIDQTPVVQEVPKAVPKPMYTAQNFIDAYNALTTEMGFMIGAHPEFKFRDDGTYSVIVVFSAEKKP